MLVTVEGKEITKIPHPETWELINLRLSKEELDPIKEAMVKVLDECTWTVAGWVPGSDWSDTVYQVIYDKAAKSDYNLAAKMYGLIFWVVVMEHGAKWAFVEDRTGSKRYFRIGPEDIDILEEGMEEFKERAFPNSKYSDQTGMELRDYFAIKVAVAFIRNLGQTSLSYFESKRIARESYSFADAMLEARKDG